MYAVFTSAFLHVHYFIYHQGNGSIETLDLSDNDMGTRGAEYLSDALRENTFIRSLVRIPLSFVLTYTRV